MNQVPGGVERATFRRAITAVRRALIVLPSDHVYEIDEIGAFEIPAAPVIVSRARVPSERRARVRLSNPRFAPPVWQLHRRRFARTLQNGMPFGLLGEELLQRLAGLSAWISVPAGGTLFAEGTPLDAIYVVVQGHVALSRAAGSSLSSLGVAQAGDTLGVASLLGQYGALATATSRTGASVLRLPTSAVIDAACESPTFYAALARIGEVRTHCHLLAGSAFADFIGAEGRAGLASLFRRVTLAPREPLVRPGELRSFLAVVEQGQLAQSTFAQGALGPERVQRLVARGQVLGCVAGLQGRGAVGAVRAIEPAVVSLLDESALARAQLLHRGIAGLPALLHARGELAPGGFFFGDQARTLPAVGWRARQEQLRRVA